MQTLHSKTGAGRQQIGTDQFFERHHRGVVARVEALTRKALDRQRAAWRDAVRRQAVLEGKDFEWSDGE